MSYGSQSCFNTEVPFVVQSLQQTVRESAKSNKSKSYTQYLLKEGIENF